MSKNILSQIITPGVGLQSSSETTLSWDFSPTRGLTCCSEWLRDASVNTTDWNPRIHLHLAASSLNVLGNEIKENGLQLSLWLLWRKLLLGFVVQPFVCQPQHVYYLMIIKWCRPYAWIYVLTLGLVSFYVHCLISLCIDLVIRLVLWTILRYDGSISSEVFQYLSSRESEMS